MSVRRLYWRDIAPGAALHAALFANERTGGFQITPHDHDFAEMFLVTQGRGTHFINGRRLPLLAGDLWFIRPPDVHGIAIPAGGKLHWMNVAFPAAVWRDYAAAAGLSPDWGAAPLPPQTTIRPERLPDAAGVFEVALRVYAARRAEAPPSRFALCRFLGDALTFLPALAPTEAALPVALSPDAPDWLKDACFALARDPELFALGLPALREKSGVSAGHLARALKSAAGQTPTEFVNALRLARAAELLTATALPILEIAADCGFSQLSYFYRLFAKRYRLSPHAYRRAARRPVAPSYKK